MRKAAVLVGALVLAGCATAQPARLYDLTNGGQMTMMSSKGWSNRGTVWFGQSRASATCRGEYSTVTQDEVSLKTGFVGTQAVTLVEGSGNDRASGRAIVTCPGGLIIECSYETANGRGTGTCQDNRSGQYRLMF